MVSTGTTTSKLLQEVIRTRAEVQETIKHIEKSRTKVTLTAGENYALHHEVGCSSSADLLKRILDRLQRILTQLQNIASAQGITKL
jgi:hypothetical protein